MVNLVVRSTRVLIVESGMGMTPARCRPIGAIGRGRAYYPAVGTHDDDVALWCPTSPIALAFVFLEVITFGLVCMGVLLSEDPLRLWTMFITTLIIVTLLTAGLRRDGIPR